MVPETVSAGHIINYNFTIDPMLIERYQHGVTFERYILYYYNYYIKFCQFGSSTINSPCMVQGRKITKVIII